MENRTRREFIAQLASAGAVAASASATGAHSDAAAQPWYRTTLRWGQTNITEKDPSRYDIGWWRQYWRRTRVQGVIVNAGGIYAYYPSKFPLHYRPDWLGGRDLFGELAAAAREEGLVVVARMDSSRAAEPAFRAHPEWFAMDPAGKPYRAGDRYSTCVHGAYYEEFIPSILREIAERYHPDGFTDNSWSGLGRDSICHCDNCRRSFRQRTGKDIPQRKDWDDPVYRAWIRWNYDRRLEIWDLNNRTTRSAGGPDCIWAGMNSGSIGGQASSFRDLKAICERSEMVFLDHQRRSNAAGFPQNAECGKLVHGLLGWEKLAPESMALYQAGDATYRLSAKPASEARMWMYSGFAGGIQPWWHHVGAYHEDRRAYNTAEPVFRWHESSQEFLVNRKPVAAVGLVWSQENSDYYGRDEAADLVESAWRGWVNALVRARIPYVPVHADHVEREAPGLSALVLPNLAAVSDEQAAAIRRFAASGGGVVATGESGRFTPAGEPRPGNAFAELLGVDDRSVITKAGDSPFRKWARETQHSYLRLFPERRAAVPGPRTGAEPAAAGTRHPVLRGFDETDIIGYGGGLRPLKVAGDATVLMTYIPPFPVYPPETSWMREERTDLPGLIVREPGGGTRTAFLPADIDRRFSRDNLPDHGDLLENLARWAARDRTPLVVEGPGLLDCHLYRQKGRLILHIVNLTGPGAWRAPIHELVAVGPLRVRIQHREGKEAPSVRSLVRAGRLRARRSGEWCSFELPMIVDHEVVVIE